MYVDGMADFKYCWLWWILSMFKYVYVDGMVDFDVLFMV